MVTGGAGFIGSHLSEELERRGYYTIILDDLSTGSLENIAGLQKKDNVQFVRGSVTDSRLLQKLLHDVEYVFHQGAIARVPRSIDDPLLANEVNITGTLNVLLAARGNGVKKVIYASSSSAYGDTLVLPKREDMKPKPLSPYAVSKLIGEQYCKVFYNIYGLETVSLRYFNVFGPRQDPTSEYSAVIPKFVTSIFKDESVTIYGDGEQSRDFTYVQNVV